MLHLFILPVPDSGNLWTFYCLHSFAFSECYMTGITEDIAFAGRLPSLSNYACKDPPGFFMAWQIISFQHWIIFHCLDVPEFIHPFTYWRTSWLLLTFGNYKQSCINLCIQVLCGLKSSMHRLFPFNLEFSFPDTYSTGSLISFQVFVHQWHGKGDPPWILLLIVPTPTHSQHFQTSYLFFFQVYSS